MREKASSVLLAGLMWLLLAACIQTPPAATVAPSATVIPVAASARGSGDTLRLLYWEAPTMLNPHLTNALKDWEAIRITLEPLASFDVRGNLIPFLAAEIPSLENGGLDPAGKWVIWKLKQGVKWSDGEPFTANDVRFTFDFIANPDVNSTSSVIYQFIAKVEVLDPYTVKIDYKAPNPAWTLSFVGPYGMILPEHIYKDYNGANARKAPANILPVGTGPYRVMAPGIKPQEVLFLGTQLMETNKIVYEPNPYFREPDRPYFSRVELRGGGTVNEAARLALQDGAVDLAYNLALSKDELAQLDTGGVGRIAANFGATVEMLEFNRSDPNHVLPDGERSNKDFPHPFLSDLRVRQALDLAIDRDAIVKLYGQAGELNPNILVAPAQYVSTNMHAEYNLQKAAQLLDEAGWKDTNGDGVREKDGVEMRLVYQTSENTVRQATQRIIQKAWASIGVDAELKFIDAATYLGGDPASPNTVEHFYADVQTWDINSLSPDPGLYMQYWTCAQTPQKANNWLAGLNTTRQCSAAYDALYDASTRELDPEKRRQLFVQMNDTLIQDVVMVPLVRQARLSGVSKTLQGLDLTPWDSTVWNIKDWRRASP